MKEYLLDAPVPAGFFSYLGNFGEVEALPNIGEGFYKFEKPDWFSIKGFIDDTTVEVRFRKEVIDLTVDFLYLLFSSYREGAMDLPMLRQREQAVGKRVREHLYGP
ncbi:MAG: hypothetical protein LLF90_07910 [Methanomicrobiaceae archaeon]|uniref:hypothetical protein n=1 Tax=Methanoculleus sp. TaxID=90427 RepID=UPI00320DC044|nr:hypothetical protein [Methanomicrobiaceae archaeon]